MFLLLVFLFWANSNSTLHEALLYALAIESVIICLYMLVCGFVPLLFLLFSVIRQFTLLTATTSDWVLLLIYCDKYFISISTYSSIHLSCDSSFSYLLIIMHCQQLLCFAISNTEFALLDQHHTKLLPLFLNWLLELLFHQLVNKFFISLCFIPFIFQPSSFSRFLVFCSTERPLFKFLDNACG